MSAVTSTINLRPPGRRPPDTEVIAQQTVGLPGRRPAPADAGPGIGAVLGKYRLTGYLGEGSTCRVYRGEHTRLPLAVAVKVFRPADKGDAAALERLRLEAALLAGLNHPNVIRLWDFDDEGSHPYLVTELVDGRTLARLLDESGPLLPDWAVVLTLQVVDALEAAHRVGIIHRDVKPANVLLARDGTVKLADLGTARAGWLATEGFAAGELTGTPAYLAPEQARNPAEADHRADMYSLGATLYHLIAGRLPFPGRSVAEVVLKHLTAPVPPLGPGVPAGLAGLVGRLLAKSPADRFADYPTLRRQLQACLDASG